MPDGKSQQGNILCLKLSGKNNELITGTFEKKNQHII